MDIFHDNAMLAGVRQMLGAFAKQYIRPVAMKHDREESMPWALMKQAQIFGMTQTAVVDGRKALTGKDDEEGAGKPKSQSRQAAIGGTPTRMTLLSCEADGHTFALAYADLGDPLRVGPALAEMAAALAVNLQAGPVRSAPLEVPGMTPGAQARRLWFDGRMPDGSPVAEQAALFAHGTRVYQAVVLGARPDAAAQTFLDSLRIDR